MAHQIVNEVTMSPDQILEEAQASLKALVEFMNARSRNGTPLDAAMVAVGSLMVEYFGVMASLDPEKAFAYSMEHARHIGEEISPYLNTQLSTPISTTQH